MIWLMAKAMIVNEEGDMVDPDDESVPSVRFVASRVA